MTTGFLSRSQIYSCQTIYRDAKHKHSAALTKQRLERFIRACCWSESSSFTAQKDANTQPADIHPSKTTPPVLTECISFIFHYIRENSKYFHHIKYINQSKETKQSLTKTEITERRKCLEKRSVVKANYFKLQTLKKKKNKNQTVYFSNAKLFIATVNGGGHCGKLTMKWIRSNSFKLHITERSQLWLQPHLYRPLFQFLKF